VYFFQVTGKVGWNQPHRECLWFRSDRLKLHASDSPITLKLNGACYFRPNGFVLDIFTYAIVTWWRFCVARSFASFPCYKDHDD